MSKRVNIKRETPSYLNKAEKPLSIITIKVIKEHDGLKVGEQFNKPFSVAKKMIELGYWQRIK